MTMMTTLVRLGDIAQTWPQSFGWIRLLTYLSNCRALTLDGLVREQASGGWLKLVSCPNDEFRRMPVKVVS